MSDVKNLFCLCIKIYRIITIIPLKYSLRLLDFLENTIGSCFGLCDLPSGKLTTHSPPLTLAPIICIF